MSADLRIQFEAESVAILTMQRPPNNFFDLQLVREIVSTAYGLAGDGTRVIILTSLGKNFCAGADLSGDASLQERADISRLLYAEAVKLFELPVPLIASVNGAAVGGGLGLACAADFRFAGTSSWFRANFSVLGFHQGFGLSASLPWLVGPQQTQRILYSSARVGAEEALRLGLVDETVADEDLVAASVAFARTISAMAPLAVRAMKHTLRRDLVANVRSAVLHEAAEQERLWATDDYAVGFAAAQNRTVPVFEGH